MKKTPVPEDFSERDWLVPSAPTRDERLAEAARRFLAQPRTGGGQLTAARRDQHGQLRGAAGSLTYVDVDGDGRYLIDKAPTGWVRIAPAEFHALATAMNRLPAPQV